MTIRNALVFALVSASLLNASRVVAYEVETHADMSRAAASASSLSMDLTVLDSLGIKSSDEFPNSKNDGKLKSIIELIRDGARFEDDGLRPINHFFDPIHDDGILFTSPTWALEDRSGVPLQSYSFKDARENLHRALTAKDERERTKYFGLTFETIGRVIHHVQDMAQPQHVRLDHHLKLSDKYSESAIEDRSRYERYTDERKDDSQLYGDRRPITFARARDYWVTGKGEGMAEFTNHNFVSKDTNFLMLNGQATQRTRYALPAPDGQVEVASIQQLFAEKGKAVPEALETECSKGGQDCTITFYGTTVSDRKSGETSPNARASSLSIFDQDLQVYGKTILYRDPDTGEESLSDRLFSLNEFNFDAAHQFLIPRAVAYSAGLIDYFFRGRLAAEDASFSETGITLRVKNAIDITKYPHLVDGVMRSGGSLVVAYEYDLSAQRVLGISDPVILTQDLKPAQSSDGVYIFRLPALPQGATNARYRLVYRGGLGQETDAVFAGEFVPVSGFIVQPNYVSEDGIGGSRNIYRTQGNWKLSPNSGLAAGNTDWKGWYVDGKPTKVLSWRGPTSRYFADYYYIRGYPYLIVPFEVQIYQDGKVFSIAPGPVMGAAVMKDDNGQAWLVAICLYGSSEVVYRRPNVKNETAALYDPINAPDGWREMGRRSRVPGEEPTGVSWFFNGSGTEAQTMREWKNPAQQNPSTDLHRLKMVVRNGAAEFQNFGNLPGYTGQRVCTDSYDADDSGSSNSTSTLTGEYIIAVDYKNDEEVLARVAVESSSSASSAQTIVKDSNNTAISRAGSVEHTLTHTEKLRWGGPDLVTFSNTQTSQASWSSGQDASTYSEQSKNSYENAEITYFLDLRYDLYSHYVWGWDTETTRNRTNGSVETSGTGTFTESNRLVSNLGPEIVWFSKKETYAPQQGGSEAYIWRCWSGSNGPLGPYNGNNFGWMNNLKLGGGLWTVDTAGNLLVSQRYYSVGGYEEPGTFNFLTGTDPTTVVPGEQSGLEPSYFPGGVIH